LKHRIGIIWKYFIAYSVTATVVIFVLATLVNITIRGRYQKTIESELSNYAIFASEVFRSALDISPTDLPAATLAAQAGADKLAKNLGMQTASRITLIAPSGKVVADSEENPDQMENHSERPEIKKALSGEIGISTRYSTTLKESMNYVAAPIVENGEIKAVVRVSLKTQSINLLIGQLTRRIVFLSIAAWVIALILTFLFSSVFSSSVKQMVNLTKRLANGDFTTRTSVKSRDELSELAAALNEMSQKLQSLFGQIRTRHDELNATINSMTEGFLVLDNRLRIRLANENFKKMFVAEVARLQVAGDIIGRSYIEVVRCVGLKEMVDELLRDGQVKGKRIEFGARVFLGSGAAFKAEGEKENRFVLVFHDITVDVQFERIKADFVANASHELRTPLAAIKGYLETFEDEDPETQRRFTAVIRRNIERMSHLVSDLLLLSRLESTSPQLKFAEVNLLEAAEDVTKLVERLAKDKGIDLKIEIEPEVMVNGDAFLLEQMLLNLLDNAVKYTKHGEVILRARNEGGKVIVQVEDTGIGIPPEHLNRIFERFYRVDKTRSRELGGTGLGLSIVKHIVQLHDGEIHVDSRPGVGTTFTVYLPAKE
jgi:two-component system phosphate regulon sensor histidine kinase PhoR